MSYMTIGMWVAKFRSKQQQFKDVLTQVALQQQQLKVTSRQCATFYKKIDSKIISRVDKLVISTSLWYFKEAF